MADYKFDVYRFNGMRDQLEINANWTKLSGMSHYEDRSGKNSFIDWEDNHDDIEAYLNEAGHSVSYNVVTGQISGYGSSSGFVGTEIDGPLQETYYKVIGLPGYADNVETMALDTLSVAQLVFDEDLERPTIESLDDIVKQNEIACIKNTSVSATSLSTRLSSLE